WTGCAPRSCSARTSCSFWAGSRVDLAARLVEVAARRRPLPEEEVVQRVGVVQVAVGEARLLQLMERERAEPVPGLRVLRLEVARLSIELERARIVLGERSLDPERLRVERVEGVRRPCPIEGAEQVALLRGVVRGVQPLDGEPRRRERVDRSERAERCDSGNE